MSRLTVIFLLVGAIVPLISSQCTPKTATPLLKRAVYDFTLGLMRRINQETESHFVTSALSPWALISTMSLGAANDTLKEIQNVLRLHPQKCFNNLFFNLINQITSKPSNPAAGMLERSATIFFDGSLNIKPKFLNDVTNIAASDARIVSFYDRTVTSAIINEHVRSVTNDAIDEIVTPSDLDDVYVVMIDALYFKGAWKIPFPYEDTEISAFYNSKGQQIGDVSLMYVSSRFNTTSIDQIQAQVLELPYGEDTRYGMLIFLPYQNVTISRLIDSLKKISISSIYILFGNQEPQAVDVQIPRFKINTDINNLKELLMDMGLQNLFDQNTGNFPGISDYPLYVSNFIQKANIEVTEEGTEASAATAAFLESRMLPDQFVANKPFLFMIVDRQFHIPIFTGAYSKPSNF
ncbi:unnamed protein product [Arctia plantaginis]|uniref:Serpin domain-containing protein n=1 Tax=Arctia plantaginis TaxID=874455 RepID=A0A8S0Z700_ARCPL|nr:unnamed protein product [Arctia plantaginis]